MFMNFSYTKWFASRRDPWTEVNSYLASESEKVVHEAASIALGDKLFVCCRSDSSWDKVLHQLVKYFHACDDQGRTKIAIGVRA